jgi:transmembrane sensor
MEPNTDPEELIQRYLDGSCTPEEKALVESWHLEDFKNSEETISMQEINAAHEQMRNTIAAHTQQQPQTKKLWPRFVAAASVLLLLSIGAYFVLKPEPQTSQLVKNAIVPGSNKAILTLGNGQQINLNDAKSGQLAKAAGIKITKDKKGQITYIVENTGQPVQYNTTTTPKGGQWHLVLADGTNVWLNAASSLHYPTAFKGKQREVELTGEGYFEVAKDKTHPFLVKTGTQTVEVLGTHFNINSYVDEPTVRTTLLEGSVRLKANGQTAMLKPGEQATLATQHFKIEGGDIEEAVAWKNSQFIFNDEPLESIMRKVARWYDVDVTYNGINPQKRFGGGAFRYDNIEQLLHQLELTKGAHFKIEGRRIIATE